MDNNFTDNKNNNQGSGNGDYSAPYDADAQYGFAPSHNAGSTENSGSTENPYGQQTGGYNLNGQYYESSSSRYDSGTGESAGGYQYGGSGTYNNGTYSNGNYSNGNYSNGSSGNGNYGSGMNFGQPPRDKNGRQIPNNFGMKLTFAIIEIIITLGLTGAGASCFGGIPLICAIIATVFVCLQNKDYIEQNWDGFVTKRKVANAMLWVTAGFLIVLVVFVIVVVIMVLAGVAGYLNYNIPGLDSLTQSENRDAIYSETGNPDNSLDDLLDDIEDKLEDKPEEDTDESSAGDGTVENTYGENVKDIRGFETFTLSGEKISLPVSCEDFRAAGFKLEKTADEKLAAHDSAGYIYYDAEGDIRGTVFIYNTKDKAIKAKNGIIGGITITNLEKDDLEMVGELGFDSDLEECALVLGNKVTNEYVGGDYNSCSWWFEKGGYYTSMQIDFNSYGGINDVWIMNTLDLD